MSAISCLGFCFECFIYDIFKRRSHRFIGQLVLLGFILSGELIMRRSHSEPRASKMGGENLNKTGACCFGGTSVVGIFVGTEN